MVADFSRGPVNKRIRSNSTLSVLLLSRQAQKATAVWSLNNGDCELNPHSVLTSRRPNSMRAFWEPRRVFLLVVWWERHVTLPEIFVCNQHTSQGGRAQSVLFCRIPANQNTKRKEENKVHMGKMFWQGTNDRRHIWSLGNEAWRIFDLYLPFRINLWTFKNAKVAAVCKYLKVILIIIISESRQ